MSESDWTTSSNDALVLSLVAPSPTGGLKTITNFRPQFTYPIFGDEEQIFGYKGLRINLRYHANDMRPNVQVAFKDQFEAVGDTEPLDIDMVMREFLPEVAFQKTHDFTTAIKSVPEDWTPPGELIKTFNSIGGKSTFEVWKGSLADPLVNQLVKRIQILVPLFIEGGTALDLEDPDIDRWTVFFLYEKRAIPGETDKFTYVFAGYCTVYGFFPFRAPISPPATPIADFALDNSDFSLSQLPSRSRISQFIIIPPFQNKGLGPRLYSAIFKFYYDHLQTFEITVEDPNEAFDDMRDIADLHFLRDNIPEFSALKINTDVVLPKGGPAPNNIVDRAACEAVRQKAKIAPRQFYRVLEMHLMSQLPQSVRPTVEPPEDSGKKKSAAAKAKPDEQHEYRLWRLLVKKRIYIHNKDALGQLELEERIEKLGETVDGVEFDFARLLSKAEAQKKRVLAEDNAATSNGKRKSIDDDDAADGEQASKAKKARLASVEDE
ncbi:Acyl-CoA N-acyltransferase [Naviculisporaceae sp. PSN 640]